MVAHFQGALLQTPPMFSALKFQGKPLYQLARAGKTVERMPREITIHRLTLEKVEQNDAGHFLTFTVVCSKGTYIRTLGEDIGQYLGCGAHVVALHRLWVEAFQFQPMVGLEEVADHHLISIPDVLSPLMPTLQLSSEKSFSLRRGQEVLVEEEINEGWVTLLSEQGEFLGIGEYAKGRVSPKRLVAQIGLM